MKPIIRILTSAVAVMAIAALLPGVTVNDYLTAIWVAFLLSVLNLFVKPILIFFTLPVTIVTFGLFLLVINAVIILMVAELVSGFLVSSVWSALFFSLLLSVLQSFLFSFLKDS
ncbi:MAG: hypothetical protein CO119_00510 [Flavobacteriales bacterium CG_4_9_14_3_um_filter_40_17]|nr:MAG: hypothetical protein CO119_00510 [Flavobacteriales bacterium CG_4_9_14_3_um_filter_40_17]